MGTSVNLNGVSYSIPAVGESSWGTQVRNYLIALATGTLTKAGGSFTLTAETDFGASYGLKAVSYKSRGTVASAGVFRLGNAESIGWRNAANSGDKLLKVNASDALEYDGNPILTLANGAADTALVMNGAGTAFTWAKLANANISGTAAIAYAKLNLASSIVNADVSGSAAIAYAKLALTGSIVAGDLASTTGSGAVVLASSPTLVTPALGTPSSATLTNATGLPVSTGISGLGTGVATFLATPSSANLAAALTDETGTGANVFATSPTLVTPLLGTPTSGTLTNCTGLPIASGVSGLGTGVATFLATPSSANLRSALTDETGTGAAVFASAPALTSPTVTTNLDLLAAAEARFYNAGGTFYTGFKGGAAAANKIWTLPTADGSTDQVLKTDGSGALGWSTVATDSTAQYNVKVGNSGGTAQQANTNLLGDVKAAAGSFTFVDGDVTTGSDLITKASHGLTTGDKVYLTNSGGALPGGLSASTTYFAIATTSGTFKLASSLVNAVGNSPIDITSAAGGGTHTLQFGGFVLTSGVRGTATNDSATAGYVGEYKENVRSSATPNFSSNTTCSVDSGNVTLNDTNEVGITLTPGDWDIQGVVNFNGAAGTTASDLSIWIGTAKGTSATGEVDYANYNRNLQAWSAPVRATLVTPVWRVSIASSTTYYLKALATFAVSTLSAIGSIRARRVR